MINSSQIFTELTQIMVIGITQILITVVVFAFYDALKQKSFFRMVNKNE